MTMSRQLEERLREAIQSGRLSSGQELPSTRMLAEDLGVSRGVVVRAYGQLAAEGYLTVRQGASPRVSVLRALQHHSHARPASRSTRRIRYDLRPERPDLSQFPRRLWLRSLRQALATATDADIGYIDNQGLPPLREEIARYLARARGVAVTAERVAVTAGSTHALELLGRVMRRRGEHSIAFENPSAGLFHRLVQRAGLEPVGVAVDGEGLLVDQLASLGVRVVVTSPAHQFPTGVALSVGRRRELLRWAEENGGLVIEDDYDAEFRYDRAPIGALQGLAPDRVAYIGTTSKTLAPGLRLGWTVLPADLVAEVTDELASTVLHLAAFEQLAFADFLRRAEFDRHLRRMRGIYRRRRDTLTWVLGRELPQFPVSGIAAGLHLVLELPAGLEAAAHQAAAERGIALGLISEHALPGYQGPSGLLVGYGAIKEPAIPVAVRELAGAVADAIGSSPSRGYWAHPVSQDGRIDRVA